MYKLIFTESQKTYKPKCLILVLNATINTFEILLFWWQFDNVNGSHGEMIKMVINKNSPAIKMVRCILYCFSFVLMPLYLHDILTFPVRMPPTITKHPKKIIYFRVENAIILECQANGTPNITYVNSVNISSVQSYFTKTK